MVVNAGKSRKNVEAYVIRPPDARIAIDLLIETRSVVGVPPSNVFIFARLTADTPMTGHTELQEMAQKCKGLKFPERITSRYLRTYIATVSQVSSVVSVQLELESSPHSLTARFAAVSLFSSSSPPSDGSGMKVHQIRTSRLLHLNLVNFHA